MRFWPILVVVALVGGAVDFKHRRDRERAAAAPVTAGGIVRTDLAHFGTSPAKGAVPGHQSFVMYVAPYCPHCRSAEGRAEALTQKRPDIAVRIVDLGDECRFADKPGSKEEAARCAKLRDAGFCGTPFISVFDEQGHATATDDCLQHQGIIAFAQLTMAEERRR